MKRKDFLASVSSLVAGFGLRGFGAGYADDVDAVPVIPPALKTGDLVGITSPCGYITLEEIRPAIERLELWGFKVLIGETIGKRDFTFGGTDEERRADFQQMLDNPKVKAILCARGGYGAVRIIDLLQFEKFKQKPKWIIGFSDVTVFHSHLNRRIGVASVHSKMCNSFPDDWARAEPIQVETIESIRKVLRGEKMKYITPPHAANKEGTESGVLVGGNLKMLETLSGTSSDLYTVNKILFIEDTGEYMYNIDRMLWNLQRSGKLSQLKGLIVGGFKIRVDEGDDDFGRSLQDLVLEKVKKYKYPVCFDFPVGHQRNNYALKCGVMHRLSVNERTCTLVEM